METYVADDGAWKQRVEKEIICKLRSKGATFNPEILKYHKPHYLVYPTGTSDPNLMTGQDFIAGKKSNYFLLRSLDGPFNKTATLDNLPEVPERSMRYPDELSPPKKRVNHSVDVKGPKNDYIAMSKTRRKKSKASSKHSEAGLDDERARSCRFNEELPSRPAVRKVTKSQGNNDETKSVCKSQVSKEDARSEGKLSNKESLKSEIMARIEKMSEKELADVRQKTMEIAQREKNMDPRLTVEAVQKFDAESNKQSVKSTVSRRSGTVSSHVSYLEKQLEEERQERRKLEMELNEIKKMVETLSKSLHGQFPK